MYKYTMYILICIYLYIYNTYPLQESEILRE